MSNKNKPATKLTPAPKVPKPKKNLKALFNKANWPILIITGLALLAIVVAVVVVLVHLISTNAQQRLNSFETRTYRNSEYRVLTGDGEWKGDYDLQFTKIKDPTLAEILEYDDFETSKVMSYDEYSEFCDDWSLNQEYTDRDKNYIVFSYVDSYSSDLEASLAGVIYEEDIASLFIWDDADSGDDLEGYAIIIPTNRNVRRVDINAVLSEDEWDDIVEPRKVTPELPSIDKPVLYFYPKTETNVSVKLGNPESLTVSYPEYDSDTGWNVLARPNGDLTDLSTGRNLYSLYYESSLLDNSFNVESDGFIISREDTVSFLEDKLAKLGLNEHEAEEFIVYWLPKLQQNNYNYIRFATIDEINNAMPLDINPNPDTVIRVLMTYKGLDKPIDGIAEQQLPTTSIRDGFTVVEWGGSELKD